MSKNGDISLESLYSICHIGNMKKSLYCICHIWKSERISILYVSYVEIWKNHYTVYITYGIMKYVKLKVPIISRKRPSDFHCHLTTESKIAKRKKK